MRFIQLDQKICDMIILKQSFKVSIQISNFYFSIKLLFIKVNFENIISNIIPFNII